MNNAKMIIYNNINKNTELKGCNHTPYLPTLIGEHKRSSLSSQVMENLIKAECSSFKMCYILARHSEWNDIKPFVKCSTANGEIDYIL